MYAERIDRLAESPVREILKVIDRPGMISFAGGLPARECFPELDCSGLRQDHLQYGSSEGDLNLREQIAASLQARRLSVDADRVLILSGSQQGIDLVAKLFVDKGTRVAIELPTYVAALQAFDLYGAEYIGYQPQQVDIKDAKLTYTIPTFQNPTGYCYSRDERQALALACDTSGSVLFEDDPYRDLVYSDCDRTPVCSFVESAPWIYQSSFSKVYAPGLRIGYLACSEALYPYLVRLKQAADLHSCRISQQLVLKLLQIGDERLRDLTEFYRHRRGAFHESLQLEFGEIADWAVPAGGLFYWLTLNPEYKVDTRSLLPSAIEEGVAFMPGHSFYPTGIDAAPAIRLNFSHSTPSQARFGLGKLAKLILKSVENQG